MDEHQLAHAALGLDAPGHGDGLALGEGLAGLLEGAGAGEGVAVGRIAELGELGAVGQALRAVLVRGLRVHHVPP